jgi:hypothetical protein
MVDRGWAMPTPRHPCLSTYGVDNVLAHCCLADGHWGAHWDESLGVFWQTDTSGTYRVFAPMERRNRAQRREAARKKPRA